MRTVLMSGVAALALTFATGSMATAHAQSPAPSMSNPSEAPPAQIAPSMAPPSDAGSAAMAPRPDDASTTPPAPVTHHHRIAGDNAGSDHWAHQPGTGQSGPASSKASNIDSADTRSTIAPHLPEPKVGEGASADTLLRAAESALAAHRTGAAQQALEMAETRLLDRSTAVGEANQPDQNARVRQITDARKALASGDTRQARSAIQMALNDQAAGGGGGGSAGGASGGAGSGAGGAGTGAGTASSSGGSMGTGYSSSGSAGSSPNGQTGQGMGAGSPPAAGNQGPIEPGMSAGSTGTNAPSSGVSGNGTVGNSTDTNGASPGSSPGPK